MKSFINLLFFVSVYVLPILAKGGYYWRQYTGIVPDDALEPGKDDKDQAVYIGMTLHPGAVLLPGTIYPEAKKIYYEYDLREHSTDRDVLILCTENKEQFRWTEAQKGGSDTELTKDNESQIIRAGSDRSSLVYVGRTIIPGNVTVIGKVVVIDGVLNSMWAAHNQEAFIVSDYEVLLYDPRVAVRKQCGIINDISVNVYNYN